MAKPLPKRIPSDDCALTMEVNGEPVYPHEGEYVELFTVQAVAETRARAEMAKVQTELDAIKGEPDELARLYSILDNHYESIIGALASRIVDWNWTDLAGRPLPKPDGSKDPLRMLNAQEIYYLMNVQAGESPTERKND